MNEEVAAAADLKSAFLLCNEELIALNGQQRSLSTRTRGLFLEARRHKTGRRTDGGGTRRKLTSFGEVTAKTMRHHFRKFGVAASFATSVVLAIYVQNELQPGLDRILVSRGNMHDDPILSRGLLLRPATGINLQRCRAVWPETD